MYNLIKNLNTCAGVSGRETSISNKILTYMAPLTDKAWEDPMGNLIAVKKGKSENAKKIMLCAHMDEIGFMVTHIDDRGFIRIAPIGGINFVSASFSYVISENGVRGVLVPDSGTAPADIKADKVYIDIGAKDRKEAEKKVKIGDFFVCEANVHKVGKKLCGRPMDDRIGCAIMIKMAEKLKDIEIDNDIYYCFAVQEEVGTRGSKPASFAIDPDCGLAFDVTGTGDTPGAKPMECSVGGGAAIKLKDASVLCDRDIVARLTEIAKAHDIKYQYEILQFGGTDTNSMQMTRGGVKAGAISIPTRYIHSNVEMIDVSDVEACIDLAIAFVTEY